MRTQSGLFRATNDSKSQRNGSGICHTRALIASTSEGVHGRWSDWFHRSSAVVAPAVRPTRYSENDQLAAAYSSERARAATRNGKLWLRLLQWPCVDHLVCMCASGDGVRVLVVGFRGLRGWLVDGDWLGQRD